MAMLLASCGGGSAVDGGNATAPDTQVLASKKAKGPKHDTTTSTPPPTTTTTPPPDTSTTTPATGDGRVVPAGFFGMHLAAQAADGWPTAKFGIQRIWDSWPGVSWSDLNPAQGKYDWTKLDALVNDSLSHGVELVYTFGYVPGWASSNPNGDCNGAASGSCYAPQAQAWADFVNQITLRYKGKIKYWELWNEPNAGNFWKGSNAQLVGMAKQAYTIVTNNGGTVLSPAPQGSNGDVWLDGYLAAGGAPYADIMAFHGYLYGPPEKITPLAAGMRTLQTKYSLNGQQLWDTEHSWGDKTWPMGADQDQQSAWLARYIVLSFSDGIDRSFWYGWEHFTWGTLYDRNTRQILKPGIAYREVYDWLIGASFSPCQNNGALYQCRITRANGYQGLIVWNTSGQTSFTVPSGYAHVRTIDAQTSPVAGGQALSVGIKPVLIENQ